MEHSVINSNFFIKPSPWGSWTYVEEVVGRLQVPEVTYYTKERVFSRHNSTDAHMNSLRPWQQVQIQVREDPNADRGKWILTFTLNQKAVCNWYQLIKKTKA